jgi:hypothetical protein
MKVGSLIFENCEYTSETFLIVFWFLENHSLYIKNRLYVLVQEPQFHVFENHH